MVANSTIRPGNLPFDLTSFVGRRRESAEIRMLLRSSRLVSLTGLGGVGKTRLALRVAADAERDFTDGAWFVDLAPLRDSGLVAQAFVAALGIRDTKDARSLASLTEFLHDRQTLLIVDNAEHVIDACSALTDALLRATQELTILATTRQPLGVPGEHIFAVQPLPTPDPDGPVPPATSLTQYDAVSLLVERARAAEPTFAITPENAEAVTRLAQHLEGVPLAIELAAARLRVLSPQQLLDRLGDRYDLLTSTARTASSRQRSLQALIDWSFDLCTEQERLLWARLAVFPRDFEIDAAEEICAGDALPREAVLHALSGLVDKSIVVTAVKGMDKRLRLPETLREYGRTRLMRLESERQLQRRHRDYYHRLAEQSNIEWFGPRQVEWMAWLDAEYVNLRAALEFCLTEPEQASEGLALALRMSPHWVVSGSFGEGRRLLDRILAAHQEPSAGRAMALWIAARMALEQGDVNAAENAAEESHTLARQYGNARELSFALGLLGSVRVARENNTDAERLFGKAIAAAEDDPLATSLALIGAGMLAADRGDTATAKEVFERCLAICDAHEESATRAEALWGYALLAWQEGDLAETRIRAADALRRMRAMGNRVLIANCLEVLAWVAASEFGSNRAAELLGAAGALREALGIQLPGSLSPAHHSCRERVQRAIGRREFDKATNEGRRLRVDDVISRTLGEQPDATARRTNQEEAMLTRRERQVADLIAEGLTNRDIATTLVISQRTAETHVEHILTKFGFTSRSQIAAWVAERRAAPGD